MEISFGFNARNTATIQALSKAFGMIEFEPNGTILTANKHFLDLVDYKLEEIVGKHHRIFCDKSFVDSHEYGEFWKRIESGNHNAGEFRRIAKSGKNVCIQASYNPVVDSRSKVVRVVKLAADITAAKILSLENQAKLDAVSRAQAVITFTVAGDILDANENFLSAMGYNKSDIVGRHHRMFMDPKEAQTAAYQEFWDRLGRGEFFAQEFRRIGKDGSEVWIQASYNPVFDANGKW